MSFSRYSKQISLLAKVALMLFAFWFVLHGIDTAEIKKILSEQDHSFLVEASLLILTQVVLGAARWRVILQAMSEKLSSLRTLVFFYISVFFNCCLPGTVGGDVIRVFLLKSEHIQIPIAISSVIIDRMIALIALGIIGFFTLPILCDYIGVSVLLVAPITAIIGMFGLWLLFNLHKFPVLHRLHFIEHLAQSLRLILLRPQATFWALFIACVAHSCYFLCALVLAKSLGISLSFADIFTLMPWVLLITIIPLSIGGWGLREAAMVYMFAFVGVSQEAALAISVQLGLISIVTSLPAGVLWLFNKGKK